MRLSGTRTRTGKDGSRRISPILLRGVVVAGSLAMSGWTMQASAADQGLTREVWTGISGSTVANLTGHPNFAKAPNSTSVLTSAQAPSNVGDSYGQRLRGYLVPPTSGSYTFWIASDDSSELWLSTDDQPANKRRIASVSGYAGPQEWTKQGSQQSAAVTLQAGKRYYIEVLHKEGSGSDHLAVAWQTSGISRQVIPGSALQPWGSSSGGSQPAPSAGGLTGAYFNGTNFNTPVLTRNDQAINFAWATGSPATGVNSDNFSVRWTGQIEPAHSSGTQTYTFYTTADDGVRLWVDGKLLIDNWSNQSATTRSGTVSLAAGRKYDIKLEYYEGTGNASVKLEWQTSGVSRQTVPGSRLYAGGGSTGGTTNPGTGGGTTDPGAGGGTTNPGTGGGTTDPGNGGGTTAPVTSVNLSWDVPLTRTDGSTLQMYDIGGYRVKYGLASGQYGTVVTLPNANTTTYTVNNLTSGKTYYFVVTAFDKNGVESTNSNEVSKVIGK